MKKVGLAALVAFLLILSPIVAFLGSEEPATAGPGRPSAAALADIPAELLPIYQKAAKDTCGMPWEVLAAIGKIETDHGRSTLPGVHSDQNFAGAKGPMQFLQGTWDAYGVDGDGDGDKDVYDSVDAIWGAAKYLCSNGAGEGNEQRLHDAIWNYNHSEAYVADVLRIAASYREAGTGIGSTDVQALLNNPRLILPPESRQDLQTPGMIDQRVVDFLGWAVANHEIAVSVLKTGHSQYVAGTDRVSNHYMGRAVDIAAVDGEAVRPSSGASRRFVEEIIALDAGHPDEVGQPWDDLVGARGRNVFTDSSHKGHVHVGFAGVVVRL